MRSFKGAEYIADSNGSQGTTKGVYKVLSILLSILLLISIVFGSFFVQGLRPNEHGNKNVAEAWSISLFCDGNLGSNMSIGDKNDWHSAILDGGFPGENQRRRLLANEAFGHSLAWYGYEGETGDEERRDDWAREDGRVGPTEPSDFTADNVGSQADREAARTRVYSARTWTNCATNDSWLTIASIGLIVAKTFTSLNSLISTKIFTGNLVCEKPDASAVNDVKNGCLDLLWITGGSGNEGDGIIGTFTSGIYLPLLLLMGLSVAIWVAWKGIVKRAFREALFGAIWAAGAVIIGLAFLLNPALVARGPAVVANTLSGCIVSTFGGNNCLTNEPTRLSEVTMETSSDKICSPDLSSVPASENMGLIAASLNCSIWKAFVLEPWTSANFGEGLNSMDTLRADSAGSRLAARANVDSGKFNEGRNGFCVSLTPTGTIKQAIADDTLKLSGGQTVCNIALFQLYVMTNAEDSGNMPNPCPSGVCTTGQVDLNWYKMIDTMSTSDNSWNAWGGGKTASVTKIFASAMMAISSIVGNIVLITVGVFAVVYYLSAVLLMMLAPLFLLIGIHPGKGRDLLKGWGEMVLSNLFKYLMSTIFLIIALVLYGGVLGASTSPGMTLVIVLVLSVALFMYRKELVDMVGNVNMGGKQLGAGVANGFKSNASRLAKTTAGAAVGGATSGGIKGAWAATTENAGREMRRQGGILGNVGHGLGMGAETANRMNRDEIKNVIDGNREAATTSSVRTAEAESVYNNANSELNDLVTKLNDLSGLMDTKKAEIAAGGGDKLMEGWRSGGNASVDSNIAQMITAIDSINMGESERQDLNLQINDISDRLTSASDEEAEGLTKQKEALEAQLKVVSQNIEKASDDYTGAGLRLSNAGVNDKEVELREHEMRQEIQASDQKLKNDIEDYNNLVTSFDNEAPKVEEKRIAALEANNNLVAARMEESTATARADQVEEAYSNIRSNKALNKRDKRRVLGNDTPRNESELEDIRSDGLNEYQNIQSTQVNPRQNLGGGD